MKLLVVDFSAVFWRSWHASADEALSYAVQRTCDTVHSHAREYEHTVIALDSPDLWRCDIWSGYKANRPPKDELALEQMRIAQSKLAAEYPTVRAPRCEADDVIAAIIGQLEVRKSHVTILSGDKDLLQLLDESVDLWHIGQNKRINSLDAETICGVSPARIAEWLALCGDKADNVLGVDGVGPKRAAELLTKYGTIGHIYDALRETPDAFTPKIRQSLLDAASREECNIKTACKLVTLDFHGANCPLKTIEGENIASIIEHLKTWRKPMPKPPIIDDADLEPEAPAPAPEPSQPHAPSSQPRALVAAPATDWKRALEPTDSRTAYGLAKVIVSSRMFSGYGTPEQAMLVIMAGREFGMQAMASLRSFHIVEGKPTMSAQAMMGRCLEHPSCRVFRVIASECTHERAVVEVQRHGWAQPERYVWTIEDAKRAGLAGRGNWTKYPREMLINRTIAEAARFTWPEVMAGVHSPEEFGGVS